jgi:hypothetical protein
VGLGCGGQPGWAGADDDEWVAGVPGDCGNALIGDGHDVSPSEVLSMWVDA